MVWSQYTEEANLINRDAHQISEEDDELYNYRNVELSLDDWITWHSVDIMNMWRSLQTYLHDTCIQHDMLNGMDYDDFCKMCYENSSKYPSKNST